MGKNFYIFHRTLCKTGSRLAASMGWKHGSVGGGIADSDAVVIRWGNATSFPAGKRPDTVFNKPEAIRLAANKAEALRALKAGQVACLTLLDFNRPQLPALGRPFHHERREGMFPCHTQAEVAAAKTNGAEYFVNLLAEGFREYRVHCFLGSAIRCVRKHSMTNEETVREPNPTMVSTALKAVKTLGLDFGAVDIVRETNGAWTVLEVNTAPEVDGPDMPAWLAALRDLEKYINNKYEVGQIAAKYANLES